MRLFRAQPPPTCAPKWQLVQLKAGVLNDPILYGGLASGLSPNSSGFTGEIAYMAFGTGRAPGWPWFNARIGLQHVLQQIRRHDRRRS
jgi:hypothetical protein